jgi:hypothetical protein
MRAAQPTRTSSGVLFMNSKRARASRPWLCLVFVPMLVLLMGARTVPLVDPAPILVPAGSPIKNVERSIKAGLVGRQWTIGVDEPGHIVAQLNLRTHMAKIDVAYDTSAIAMKYLDSSDLLFEDTKEGRVIHRNYLNWMQNLVTDISRNLQLSAP